MLAVPLPVRVSTLVVTLLVSLSLPANARDLLRSSSEPRLGEVWLAQARFEDPGVRGAALLAQAPGLGEPFELAREGMAPGGPESGVLRVRWPDEPARAGLPLKVWAVGWSDFGGRHVTRPIEVRLGGGTPQVDRFALLSCSLECGPVGPQMNCSQQSIAVNTKLAFTFNEPVDLHWLQFNKAAFRIFDQVTGASPAGEFAVFPESPNTLVFNPQVSLNLLSQTSFSFEINGAYQIQMNGTAGGGSGPYLQSVSGRPVATRLLCSVVADGGVEDYTPGSPTASVSTTPGGASIEIAFDDVVDMSTVYVLGTGQMPFIEITSGGVPLTGNGQILISTLFSSSKLIFVPDQPPGVGSTIEVELKPGIVDLVGTPLSNPGTIQLQG